MCEGMMYLHHPQFEMLKDAIASGRLGQVVSIGSRFGIPRLEYASFRSDPQLGGGALFDVGCYPISAIHTLFPDGEINVVTSRVEWRDGSAVDTDGAVVLEVLGGPTAYLEWHQLDHMPEQFAIPGLPWGQRFVSPPSCVAASAARDDDLGLADSLQLYFIEDPVRVLPEFQALGRELAGAGRFLTSIESRLQAELQLVNTWASPRVLIGPEVVPYRPNHGAYVIVEHVDAVARDVARFTLLLSPDVIDFGKPVTVTVNGTQVASLAVKKDIATLLKWAARDNDRTVLYGAELSVAVP